ncbi:MAG: hypothetical protein JRM72_04045 [Nitrososphaerota archaeon]|nr:hypothetical protein [Nitrososphaerota archaeon]
MTDIDFSRAELTKEEFDRIAPGYLDTFADASQHRWKLSEWADYKDSEGNHLYEVLYDYAGEWYQYGFISTDEMDVKAYNKTMAEHRKAAIREFKAILAEVD